MSRPSKFQYCVEEVVNRINTGVYTSEQALPSELELMNEFGMSRSTVRKALDDLKSRKLIHAIKGRGYFICPDVLPELSKGKVIGLLLSINFENFNTEHLSCLLYSNLEEKLANQMSKLVHIAPNKINSVVELVETLENFEGDAIIVSDSIFTYLNDYEMVHELLVNLDKRVIMFGSQKPYRFSSLDTVYTNWTAAVEETIHILVQKGLTKISFAGYDGISWSDERKAAFLLAMRKYELWDFGQDIPLFTSKKVSADFSIVGYPDVMDCAREAADSFLEYYTKEQDIDALICVNDHLVKSFTAKASLEELPVLIGFDNSFWSRQNRISSIGHDIGSICNVILKLLAARPQPQFTNIPVPAMFFDRM